MAGHSSFGGGAAPALTGADATADGLAVAWGDGRRFVFHPLWLRERAPDPATLDPRTSQRLIEAAFLPGDLAVTGATVLDNGCLQVAFSDGHCS